MAPSTARHDMIMSAIQLFRERGIDGTAFSDVIEHSGAPRGSIYHHFPGGKSQLVEEATATAGELLDGAIAAVAERVATPGEVLDAFVGYWRPLLEQSDYQAGCPIAAAAVASHEVTGGVEAAGRAFTSWELTLAAAFERYGVPVDRAGSLATLMVSSIEGAILLCRSTRSYEPMERVRRELRAVLDGTVPAA